MPELRFTTEDNHYPYGAVRPTLLGGGRSINELSAIDSLKFRQNLDRGACSYLDGASRVYLGFSRNLIAPFSWGRAVEILGTIDEVLGSHFPVVRIDCLKGIRDCVSGYIALSQEAPIDSGHMTMALTYLPPDSVAWREAERAGALEIKDLNNTRHMTWVEKRQISWAI